MSADSKVKENGVAGKPFVITALLDAPKELVYKVYTHKEHMSKWFGPKGFDLEVFKFEAKPGGVFHYKMSGPNGFDMYGKFNYREFIENEKIVHVTSFVDKEGEVARHPMSPNWPLETQQTTTFETQGDKTLLTVSAVPINVSAEECKTFEDGFEGMKAGYSANLEKLVAYLKTLS